MDIESRVENYHLVRSLPDHPMVSGVAAANKTGTISLCFRDR